MMIIEQKTKTHVINDIIATAKIFDGDIFGSAIRDYKLTGNTRIQDVDIRLDSHSFKPFIILLHTKYNVKQLPDKLYNGITIQTFTLSPKTSNMFFFPINIDIVLMSRHMFRISFLDFDVNLFTENERAIFLRFVPHMLKYLPDKFSYIKERIIAKQFTYLPSEKQLTDLCIIIEKAVKMTHANWTMDDAFHQKDTWVVGKWDGFLTGKHRKNYTREKFTKMSECNTCSLCHEKFAPHDIVLNTACNHVFHWKCNATTGLNVWAKEHSTCPYCRSEMFSS